MNTNLTGNWLEAAPCENGVRILAGPSLFADLYGQVRDAERRLLTDEEVRALPNGDALWNADEWRIRARGARRLVHVLEQEDRPLKILDVGCGNGWLTNLLHQQGHMTTGIDAFTAELEQAARLFPGPDFARADLITSELPKEHYDVIVFAASFQYFADAAGTLARCRELLGARGEVHILDTILYQSRTEVEDARTRSTNYYAELGFPEMAGHYHMHRLSDVQAAGRCRILSAPGGMDRTLARFGRPASPFTHIVVRP
ncbi:MAG TPA: methyltransferase domain-containing protein [Flavobacteriales bacterium]|nr:methyltransferase domain-containing protein [Flavobacteriales bacterium]HNU55830.1 methyltransferase domain-containing protein [Flavobacteriales bacterium]